MSKNELGERIHQAIMERWPIWDLGPTDPSIGICLNPKLVLETDQDPLYGKWIAINYVSPYHPKGCVKITIYPRLQEITPLNYIVKIDSIVPAIEQMLDKIEELEKYEADRLHFVAQMREIRKKKASLLSKGRTELDKIVQ